MYEAAGRHTAAVALASAQTWSWGWSHSSCILFHHFYPPSLFPLQLLLHHHSLRLPGLSTISSFPNLAASALSPTNSLIPHYLPLLRLQQALAPLQPETWNMCLIWPEQAHASCPSLKHVQTQAKPSKGKHLEGLRGGHGSKGCLRQQGRARGGGRGEADRHQRVRSGEWEQRVGIKLLYLPTVCPTSALLTSCLYQCLPHTSVFPTEEVGKGGKLKMTLQ